MADIQTYDIGDTVRFTAAFTNAADAADDPSTVTLKIREPDSTETSYVYLTDAEVVRDSEGNFHADLVVDASGSWYWRWVGTGDVATATAGSIVVRASHFAAP